MREREREREKERVGWKERSERRSQTYKGIERRENAIVFDKGCAVLM